jgi:hypothetical protein
MEGNVSKRGTTVALLILAVACLPALAQRGAQKNVPRGYQLVDSGSYGIFVNGARVATESFTITQSSSGSVISSELRVESGEDRLRESSELLMASNGDLQRYQWTEASPGKATVLVEPSDVFLVSRVSTGPSEKPMDVPYLLPHSTVILDDYVFTHRQILAWRYMAGGCRPSGGALECSLAKSHFGVLVPRQRVSVSVTMEYTGRDKVTLSGVARDFNRFVLSMEGEEWILWLDDNNKLVRVLVPDHNTEVIRD